LDSAPGAEAPGATASETASRTTTEPDWLAGLRRRSAEAYDLLPMPVRKDKGWEFTDVATLDLDAYLVATDGDLSAAPGRELLVDRGQGPGVLQVDGAAERRGEGEPDGVIVTTLEEAVAHHPELVEPHLGRQVSDRDKFSAQNAAAWRGGAFVYVPESVRVEAPVVLSAIQVSAGSAMFWRSLIVVEREAELTVAEQFLSGEQDLDGYFNPVAELVVSEGAKVSYLCVQDLSERSWILGNQRAQVSRDATLHWIGLGLGSGQGKLRMETDLRGRGADARVTGAYVGHGRQHLDYDTTQEHAAPDTTSDLAFRGILRDSATAVWSGMIRVDPDAQRTDAFQESRNLLLSERAHADAIPGLEIEANDVRCTHAATIGRIDEEQLFYLMSRGLSRGESERLLVRGFLEVIAGRLEDTPFLHRAVTAAIEREVEDMLT
jgi:Fe-S cluster assembly protein SufD